MIHTTKQQNDMEIDRSKPVLVTGATGYVAGWLVKKLLEEGLTVHAAVRDPEHPTKLSHLNKIAEESNGSIRYFKSDLLKEGSYDEAAKDCELIFHTASPFVTDVKNPQKDLIDPAVKGTENVLNAASKSSSVKRVVLTSSCAAIYTDAIDCQAAPNGVLTEKQWNTTASIHYQPYSYSKTVAEQTAWKIAGSQTQWDMVTINPSFVMGPALNPSSTNSESINVLTQYGDGTFKVGAPKMGVGVVDVRDVAEAHFQAGFNPKANGRYITSGHNSNFLEMAEALIPKYGANYPIPTKKIPKWLLMLVGPMLNKILTRKYIKNNCDIEWKADNSKIKNELGITFRPLQTTMEDGFQSLIDAKILAKA